ncbi:hypothetical protein FACS189493_8110 [Spirochaetia bacterium]|nr:hypothetical protein FACS189493_8110 [Spirochaetia bacterium]
MKISYSAVVVLLTTLSLPLFAQTESDFEVDYRGRITRYTGTSKAVVIPAVIGGKPITSIGSGAFREDELTNITIPDGVTDIYGSAFYNNKLTNVTIPNTVTSISSEAFRKNQLTSVTLPNNVSIDRDAFSENPGVGLEDYYKSEGRKAGIYTVIGSGWVRNLSDEEAKLAATEDDFDIIQLPDGTLSITKYLGVAKNVIIPATISDVRVTKIAKDVFDGKGIQSVVIPDTITEIGEGAFANNPLTNVTFGKGLKTILSGAFSNNRSLTTLVIPDGVTEIARDAFSDCWLSGITFGKGLVKIGYSAFQHNNITEITIPNGVTYIGQYAFSDNPLTAITLPASLANHQVSRSGVENSAFTTDDKVPATVTRITVPANMEEYGGLQYFPTGFLNFWKSQNKAAGTYVLNGRLWTKQ